MGNSSFEPISVVVENRKPNGALPADERFTVLTRERFYVLDEYFTDPDGDPLTYLLQTDSGEYLDAELSNNVLTVHPLKSGTQTILLEVSDGESAYTYEYEIEITPLWKAYGWVFALLAGGAAGIVIWKITHKPRPALERLAEETKKKHIVFIAGGLGTAPVYPQVKWLKEHGVDADVIMGFRNKDILCFEDEMKAVAKNL